MTGRRRSACAGRCPASSQGRSLNILAEWDHPQTSISGRAHHERFNAPTASAGAASVDFLDCINVSDAGEDPPTLPREIGDAKRPWSWNSSTLGLTKRSASSEQPTIPFACRPSSSVSSPRSTMRATLRPRPFRRKFRAWSLRLSHRPGESAGRIMGRSIVARSWPCLCRLAWIHQPARASSTRR